MTTADTKKDDGIFETEKYQFKPGEVSVNVDQEEITPISHEKINKVNANNWNNLSVTELYEQLGTLNTRLVYAQQLNNITIVEQIQRGITQLNMLLSQRNDNHEGPGIY